jgi:hypothetical protein
MTAGEWDYVQQAHPGVASYLTAAPSVPPPPPMLVMPVEVADATPSKFPSQPPQAKGERKSRVEGETDG